MTKRLNGTSSKLENFLTFIPPFLLSKTRPTILQEDYILSNFTRGIGCYSITNRRVWKENEQVDGCTIVGIHGVETWTTSFQQNMHFMLEKTQPYSRKNWKAAFSSSSFAGFTPVKSTSLRELLISSTEIGMLHWQQIDE